MFKILAILLAFISLACYAIEEFDRAIYVILSAIFSWMISEWK